MGDAGGHFDNRDHWVFDNLQDFPSLLDGPPGGATRQGIPSDSVSVLIRSLSPGDLGAPPGDPGAAPDSLLGPAGARVWEVYGPQQTGTAASLCDGSGHKIALLIYNFDNGPLQQNISDNITGMAGTLSANGFQVPQFESSTGTGDMQPGIYIGDRGGRGLQQLRDFVQAHSGPEHCCDQIFIYYSGHGKETTIRGEKRYYFGLKKSYKGEDGSRRSQKRLYAEDLAEILSGLGSCHIHMVIESCHAGGFIPALSAVNGVETIHVSAAASEKAWGGAVDGARRGRGPHQRSPRPGGW